MFGDVLGLRPICGQLPCRALMKSCALCRRKEIVSRCANQPMSESNWLCRCENFCGSELFCSRQPLVGFEVG